jgi:hypothetical protein
MMNTFQFMSWFGGAGAPEGNSEGFRERAKETKDLFRADYETLRSLRFLL